uniref:Adenosine kinase n=1 Tax=Plectus sambesii TaxID=2011161 RepID=A0A914UID9_9BILA
MAGQLEKGTLLGMGNPLLDLQTDVDQAFLDKWSLKANDAILADDKHVPMFTELVDKYNIEFIPGGATQNALRVCQWILNQPKVATFFGAVGKDNYAETLEQKASEAGVNVKYQHHPEIKTGTCAALILGEHRSLCAHLAAANCFTTDHLDIPENKESVEKAKFYYIAGFFLTVCPPAIIRVATHAAEHNKVFMMNLSAPFLSQFFKEPMLAALPYVDILFGNETEALEFSKNNDFNTDKISEIALKIGSWDKVNKKRKRMVVITQGDQPTIVAMDGKITEYPVKSLTKEQLVDTNGAGDAFVGGFLAQYIQGKSVAECVECGNYAAHAIIQQQGCTFPSKCDYHH